MTEKLSLTELQLIIRDSLYLALPDMYWVTAEISEIKENSAGHCYLELIEKQPDDKNVKAKVKAIIWSSRYRFLKSLFINITGEPLREGLRILVKSKVEYHELYGLSLVISDIDPVFTVGEMALKRQLIIKKLEDEGVFSMNKEIEFPFIPRRIAIISSSNAAGFTDFMNHLSENSYGYHFYTALFESAMQGNETEEGVICALDKIASNAHLFDLVVLIRGGGSQSDLSWFDNYNIAYHVTQFPLPVVTGIGHEKDMSVTDMVAHRSLKTPTAVADFLIECVAQAENHFIEMSSEIKDLSRIILEKNRSIIERSSIKLFPLTKIMISGHKDKLSGMKLEITNTGKEYTLRAGIIPAKHGSRLVSSVKNALNNVKIRLEGFENSLNILNPENVMQRGFTITSLKGKILRRSDQVKSDDLIDTQFSDGSVKSRVVNKKGSTA